MMLRRLVTDWLRQTAQEKIFEAVASAGAGATPTTVPDQTPEAGATGRPALPACQVALVFALGVEAGGVVDQLEHRLSARLPTFLEHVGYFGRRAVVVAESGVGGEAAAQATRDLVRLHHPRWIICAGFACALVPELRRGHVLMADEVVDTQGERLPIDLPLSRWEGSRPSPGLHLGRLLSVDTVVRTPDHRRQLAQQSDALACDMETLAVARACREHQVNMLSVRIISDAVDDQWPVEIEQLLQHQSLAAKLGVATGALWKRPSSIKDMWHLKEEALKASDRLARFLGGVVEQLATPHQPPETRLTQES